MANFSTSQAVARFLQELNIAADFSSLNVCLSEPPSDGRYRRDTQSTLFLYAASAQGPTVAIAALPSLRESPG